MQSLHDQILEDKRLNGIEHKFSNTTTWDVAIKGSEERIFYVCIDVMKDSQYFNTLIGNALVNKPLWLNSSERFTLFPRVTMERYQMTDKPLIWFKDVSVSVLSNIIRWMYSGFVMPKKTQQLIDAWKFSININFTVLTDQLTMGIFGLMAGKIKRNDIPKSIELYEMIQPYDHKGISAFLLARIRQHQEYTSRIQTDFHITLSELSDVEPLTVATIKNNGFVEDIEWKVKALIRHDKLMMWATADHDEPIRNKITVEFPSATGIKAKYQLDNVCMHKEFHIDKKRNIICPDAVRSVVMPTIKMSELSHLPNGFVALTNGVKIVVMRVTLTVRM